MIHFTNAQLLRHGRLELGELWVSGGKIIAPGKNPTQQIDLAGKILAPGFIDLQVNGACGVDLTTAPEQINTVSKYLATIGVTAFLATVVSSAPEHYRKVLPILRQFIGKTEGAILLGIHLEGPCFHAQRAHAHDKHMLKSCSAFNTPEECYGNLDGVKIVTLAPELPGALSWISWLKDRGIIVSVGHSQATAEEMQAAIQAGASMATHLYNAMQPFHHRSPGIIGAVLNSPGFFYSLIADGVHVDPLALSLAWRSQPEGLILVSDAMAALGLSPGNYPLGNMQVNVTERGAKLVGSETLAGAITGLDQAVRNFSKCTGASSAAALKAASSNPARVLGIYPEKGSLGQGADADLIVLDRKLHVIGTYISKCHW